MPGIVRHGSGLTFPFGSARQPAYLGGRGQKQKRLAD